MMDFYFILINTFVIIISIISTDCADKILVYFVNRLYELDRPYRLLMSYYLQFLFFVYSLLLGYVLFDYCIIFEDEYTKEALASTFDSLNSEESQIKDSKINKDVVLIICFSVVIVFIHGICYYIKQG